MINEKINPLNVFNQRILDYMPIHFATLTLPLKKSFGLNLDYNEIQKINLWVYQNLNSRYCIRKQNALNSERKFVDFWEIGVEDPKELTLIYLACPHIKQN